MKKSVKKRKKTYKLLRVVILCVIFMGFLYTVAAQQVRLSDIRSETAECEKEIALQKEKYTRLKEKEKYNSSDKYYEEKARDEGYVREGETVFIVGN